MNFVKKIAGFYKIINRDTSTRWTICHYCENVIIETKKLNNILPPIQIQCMKYYILTSREPIYGVCYYNVT